MFIVDKHKNFESTYTIFKCPFCIVPKCFLSVKTLVGAIVGSLFWKLRNREVRLTAPKGSY